MRNNSRAFTEIFCIHLIISFYMEKDRKKRYKTRFAIARINNAKNERIENVESTSVDSTDITLSVHFQIATKLNQDMSLRRAQNSLWKQLHAYIEADFSRFVKDIFAFDAYPAIRARLFIEMIKIILPRPKENDDGTDNQEQRNKIISRLFGKQEA